MITVVISRSVSISIKPSSPEEYTAANIYINQNIILPTPARTISPKWPPIHSTCPPSPPEKPSPTPSTAASSASTATTPPCSTRPLRVRISALVTAAPPNPSLLSPHSKPEFWPALGPWTQHTCSITCASITKTARTRRA